MKFLPCSRCVTAVDDVGSKRKNVETTDPLVTKRPTVRRRFRVLRMLSAPWRRRSRSEARRRARRREKAKERRSKINEDLPDSRKKDRGRRLIYERRRDDLERAYYEQLEALEFLIDPPVTFRNYEVSRYREKLNAMDFRRINTVAIPERSFHDRSMIHPRRLCWSKTNEGCGSMFKDTKGESARLFDRDSILKGKGSERSRKKETKTVRFEVEGDDLQGNDLDRLWDPGNYWGNFRPQSSNGNSISGRSFEVIDNIEPQQPIVDRIIVKFGETCAETYDRSLDVDIKDGMVR